MHKSKFSLPLAVSSQPTAYQSYLNLLKTY